MTKIEDWRNGGERSKKIEGFSLSRKEEGRERESK